jgi:3-hydroxybutyryl-CoA dehydrogenase
MKPPRTVGVLGGGRMGAGIAHAFLLAGAEVVIVERDEETADAAAERVRASIVRSLERRTAAGTGIGAHTLEQLEAAFSTATDAAAFVDCELVVEAVPEDRELKSAALARAERAMPPSAVLATNTSSISVDDLAAGLERPQLFLGLHFFNPVPASSLVEVVVGAATAPAVLDSAREWVASIGKTAIVVRDSPGFASSRLGLALGLEAIRMLEDGVASAEDIDAAMTLGYRHPVGPLRTTDLVGLDVRLGIAEELHERLGSRFEPPALLRRMVAEGKLGRKSGQGFYEWENDR